MIDEALFEAEEKMDKAIAVAKEDFATIRTGRATPQMFNKILVDYYGAPTPINQLASFQTPEARMILISPFDKGAMGAIEKAIRQSDLGLNPSNDGNNIRLSFPPLTAERRKEFVKIVRSKAEDARVSVRNIRRKAKDDLDALKGEVGDDEVSRAEKELEQVTKSHVDQIDDALKRKEAELLEV